MCNGARVLRDATGAAIATTVNTTKQAVEHWVVKSGGRYYDALTGAAGKTWTEYLKLWHPNDTAPFLTQIK